MSADDDAVRRAMARLDAREDPAPAPDLPPPAPAAPPRRLFDQRITIDAHSDGRVEWHVFDAGGAEVNARNGLVALFAMTAQIIVTSDGWVQPLFRAARNVIATLAEIQRNTPPMPTVQ